MPLLYADEATMSSTSTVAITDHALAETIDNGRLWLLNKTDTTTPIGANAVAATPVGRWLAAIGSAPPYVDVDADFGTNNSGVSVEVGAPWVTATTSLRWSCQEATATKSPEDAALNGLTVVFTGMTPGVGFTLFAQTNSMTRGIFRIRVTGDRTLWQQG